MLISKPYIIKGEAFSDHRGGIFSCNSFDMSLVKRVYIIENIDNSFLRGWKGHKVETRWFFASRGSIRIDVIPISDLENRKSPLISVSSFALREGELDVLKVPPGFATSIKQYSNGDKVCVFADYKINTSNDEDLRWEI